MGVTLMRFILALILLMIVFGSQKQNANGEAN